MCVSSGDAEPLQPWVVSTQFPLYLSHTQTHTQSVNQSAKLAPRSKRDTHRSLFSLLQLRSSLPLSLLTPALSLHPSAKCSGFSKKTHPLPLPPLPLLLPPSSFLSVSSIFFVCYKDTLAPGPSGPQEKTTLSLWTPTVNKCIPGCLTVWMSWISLFLNIHNCSCEDFGFLLFLHSRFKHCMAKQWHCSVICSIRVNVSDLKMY